DVAAGIRNAEQVERPLDRAVLAAATVQGDEGAHITLALEVFERTFGRIEGVGIHARALQRGEHGPAALKRHLTLRRRSAEQNSHLAESLPAQASTPALPSSFCPTMRTSHSSATPNFCITTAWIWPISISISLAFATPCGLTMKLACFSETCAPPSFSPFR